MADFTKEAERHMISSLGRTWQHNVEALSSALSAAYEQGKRDELEVCAWQPIETYNLVPIRGEYYPPHALCSHSERKWIRMGRFEPTLKRWYYSGTNERSQWAQVEGDEPTHWMPLPSPPAAIRKRGEA